MKLPLKQLSVAAGIFALLSPAAHAFNPYFGEYRSIFNCKDYLVSDSEEKPRTLRCTNIDTNAVAVIRNTGGPFDAKVTVRGRSGRKKKTYVITLNSDGTGTCTSNGRLIAGIKRAASLNGVTPGSTVKTETTASGTWTLGDGVRTTLVFEGETNGVPTKITGFMDLTDEGEYVLNLKTTYKKGNGLFAKPSVDKFGP